jgi:hypothetical protein
VGHGWILATFLTSIGQPVRTSAAIAALIGLAACNGVWGLDEVQVGTGAGGGDSTSSSSSSSGDTGSSSSGVTECECGCPTELFPLGAFEDPGDATAFPWQEDTGCFGAETSIDPDCGALLLTGTETYCGHRVFAGGTIVESNECATARMRASAENQSAVLYLYFIETDDETNGYNVLEQEIGTAIVESPVTTCRLPIGWSYSRVAFDANKGSADGSMTIDFVEMELAPCPAGVVPDCVAFQR